ncbi:unnamed protein product [Chrysodeixis includens]|uniref:Uncharacterized protein n=1 Tax=Chrysodeixis includens TaxID=689277 RepID=A0A9N8KV97_CHRIL|nr:unnamed protein product [Chrysodeixis includens]
MGAEIYSVIEPAAGGEVVREAGRERCGYSTGGDRGRHDDDCSCGRTISSALIQPPSPPTSLGAGSGRARPSSALNCCEKRHLIISSDGQKTWFPLDYDARARYKAAAVAASKFVVGCKQYGVQQSEAAPQHNGTSARVACAVRPAMPHYSGNPAALATHCHIVPLTKHSQLTYTQQMNMWLKMQLPKIKVRSEGKCRQQRRQVVWRAARRVTTPARQLSPHRRLNGAPMLRYTRHESVLCAVVHDSQDVTNYSLSRGSHLKSRLPDQR